MFSSNSFGLLVSGGRGFKDYRTFVSKIDNLLSNVPQWDIHIITGDSEGVDQMARQYAAEFGYELHTFYSMYHEHEGNAVSERNISMFKYLVQNFQHLGVFIMCDGEFHSEEQQINLARYWKLPTRIHRNHALEFGGIKDLPEPEFVSAPKWFQDEPNLSNYDKFLIKHQAEKHRCDEAITLHSDHNPDEYIDETPRQKRIRRKKLLSRAAFFADMYGVWATPEWAEVEAK